MSTRVIRTAGALMLLIASGAVAGAEGVVEINQAQALAGGVTSGDAAGYPVTIDAPGHYALTGSLEVASSTPAIQIAADHVLIDLRGFTIEYTGSGTPDLITSAESGFHNHGDATIRNGSLLSAGNRGIYLGNNGTVVAMKIIGSADDGIEMAGSAVIEDSEIRFSGGHGIRVQGSASILGNRVRANGEVGISTQADAEIIGNVVSFNGSDGIRANAAGCRIAENIVRSSSDNGIFANESWVEDNTVHLNSGFGLVLSGGSGYSDNLIIDNQTGTVSGGIETGTNICSGDTNCP